MNKFLKIIKSKAVIAILCIGIGAATGGTINPVTAKLILESVAVVGETMTEKEGCQ